MRRKGVLSLAMGAALAVVGCGQKNTSSAMSTPPPPQPSAERSAPDMNPMTDQRIAREVRHELVMLPYYGVFDNLAFKLDGSNVTLIGQVTNPTLKSDAFNVVKNIEGVGTVTNDIEVLNAGLKALREKAGNAGA